MLVTLEVHKGSKRYSKSKEELKEQLCWYGREQLLELLNYEVEMAEALFKETYLKKEVKVERMEKLIPSDLPMLRS